MFSEQWRKFLDDDHFSSKIISRAVGTLALALMVAGGLDYMTLGAKVLGLPGPVALPLQDFVHIAGRPASVDLMSLGIVLLASIPSLRVLTAMAAAVHKHRWGDAAAAIAVLMVLVSGAILGK